MRLGQDICWQIPAFRSLGPGTPVVRARQYLFTLSTSKHQTLQVQQGIPDSVTRRVTNAFYDQFYPPKKLQILVFPQTHLTKSCPLPCEQHLPQPFPQSFLPKEYKLKEIKTPGLKTAHHYFYLWLHLINLYLIRAYSISVILMNIFKSFLIKKRQLLDENFLKSGNL